MAKSMMVEVVAIKRIGRAAPGERIRLEAHEAKALIALRHARLPDPEPAQPAEVSAPDRGARRGGYRRRDMVAEEPTTSVVVTIPPETKPPAPVADEPASTDDAKQ